MSQQGKVITSVHKLFPLSQSWPDNTLTFWNFIKSSLEYQILIPIIIAHKAIRIIDNWFDHGARLRWNGQAQKGPILPLSIMVISYLLSYGSNLRVTVEIGDF